MSAWLQPEPQNWWHLVDDAIMEDVGSGDVTGGIIDADALVRWGIEAAADAVICGVGIAEYLMAPYGVDPDESEIEIHHVDGDFVSRGSVVLSGVMSARRAAMAERTALNFLGHLSGIATITAAYVHRIDGTNSKIIDTRQTLPMLRGLQKYAVRCGGGANHRTGLFDGAVIEQKHISAAGSITSAVQNLKTFASHMTKIEVHCENLDDVAEAVKAGVDFVLLDNMDPFMMREAVRKFRGQCLFEAAGGIDLDTVRGVAQTGVDLISIGAITHSAPCIPFRMEFS